MIPPYKGPETNITKNELGNMREWGLFDLENDRFQKNNIAGNCPEVLQKMRSEFLDIVGDHYRPDTREEELR